TTAHRHRDWYRYFQRCRQLHSRDLLPNVRRSREWHKRKMTTMIRRRRDRTRQPEITMPSEQPGISDDERAMRLKAEYDVSVALFGFTEQTVRDDEYRRVRAILRSQATIDVIARKLFHDHILD